MNTIVNNRRKIVSKVPQLQLTYTPSTFNCEKRRLLLPKLNPKEHQVLNDCKTDHDGRTEADVFTVYECVSNNYQGRTCIETDICPTIIAERIVGLDKIDIKSKFYLPTHTIHNEEWSNLMPCFDNWLLSTIRYPTVKDDNKTIIPGSGTSTKFISQLDRLEIYFSCFNGTLIHWFYNRKDSQYLKILWQLQRTIKYVLHSYGPTKPLSTEKIQILKSLIEKRDGSEEDAQNYKIFLNDLHPAQYYHAMYDILKNNPEIGHRNRIVNPELLVWGLLTQTYIIKNSDENKNNNNNNNNNNTTNIDDIGSSLLSLFMNRGLKSSQPLPVRLHITERDQLIGLCHQHFGNNFLKTLKNFNLALSVCKTLCLSNGLIQQDSLYEGLNVMAKTIKNEDSITSLCKICCPDTFFSDEMLAEFFMTYHKNNDKFKVISYTEIKPKELNKEHPEHTEHTEHTEQQQQEQSIQTPELDKIMSEIKERLDMTKKSILEHQQIMESKDEDHILEEIKKQLSYGPVHNSAFITKSLTVLFSVCNTGDINGLKTLQHFIKTPRYTGIGIRRLRSFLIRATPRESMLGSHWKSECSFYDSLMNSDPGSKRRVNRVLWDCLNNGKIIKPKENAEEAVSLISFIPFHVVREMNEKAIVTLKHLKYVCECLICFEPKKLVPLHNDYRHAICLECSKQLKSCPFCRVDL